MQELWKLTASPRHLMVFEAAARTGSFTLAARELNVQQPAVSAAIKQIEASLGVLLFKRSHKRVELTAAGGRLFSDVTGGFDQILQSAKGIHQRARKEHVTLSASTAFAYYWMVPRLADLHAMHPEIDLRLQTSDHEPDIDAEGLSLAIRRGNGTWRGCDSVLIAEEIIFPIASPSVMANSKDLSAVGALLQERLIHLEEPIRDRPTWSQWFAHHGFSDQPPDAGLRLNDYALVLQAAIAGEGFAFGWEHVTRKLIEQGLLAGKPEWTWKTGKGFYLVWSRNSGLIQQAQEVKQWMLENAKKDRDETLF
ncbi:MAG: LysR substrate-binding domain-containing protein [Pseudomonadota bacterium]